MFNSFSGLEMSKRALNAFRLGIEVAGHNVSNADTEGYSRQRVNLSTSTPYTSPGLASPAMPGQIGTGVKIDEIVRIRDEFLDFQYRAELSDLGYWNKISKMYDTLQLYISEPQTSGINASFNAFWDSLQELQKTPEITAVRETVVENAKSLGSLIDNIVKGYDQYASLVNEEVKTAVEQVNTTLHEIAALNKEIYYVEAMGDNPNDLLDTRDLLLDKLSGMIDVDIQEPYQHGDITGEFIITMNGRALVQGDSVRELVAHAFQWENKIYYDVQVTSNEFDIVENPEVALAVAVGPEGVHQLNVSRLANGEEWAVGGYDPLCLDKDGTPVIDPETQEYVYMRRRPMTTDEALGLSAPFRIQVGTQGTQVASGIFSNTYNSLAPGVIIAEPKEGEPQTYTFKVGAQSYEANITVTWNDDEDEWEMTSDTRLYPPADPIDPADLSTPESAGPDLDVTDIADFLSSVLPKNGTNTASFNVKTYKDQNDKTTQFSITSNENWLISISDVSGGLAAKMGIVNENPAVTIDIEPEDSLETIRNKINEKYQAAYGLTNPEQWVHASLEQASDQSWYLTIASNVAGEAQRITLLAGDDGSMQSLRQLGLVREEKIGDSKDSDSEGNHIPIYREVTSYSTVAQDASFTFDGARYLSADNKFNQARRIPAANNRNDFSAKTLEQVSDGLWLELKSAGRTAITVRHHVTGGAVKAMEEIRDGLIPDLKGELDNITWSLVNNFNAYQYSGYGIGDSANETGAAFFNSLRFKSGSASLMSVTEEIDDDVSLIGAAMGKLDGEGKSSYGVSSGAGSGNNASRMAGLKTAKLLSSATASLSDFYAAYIAEFGSEAGHAALMQKAQQSLTEQIDAQRQSVMGVNIDEEMLDILRFNQSFNAMSRYATTIDEMLDRIINSFGMVGR